MVALVGGSGLGLTNTSRELAGGAGQLGEAGFGRAGETVTVNTANGNLVIQNRDEFVVGVGQDLGLVRTYNSLGGWDGDNADNWRLGYYRRVSGLTVGQNAAGSTVKRTDADGFESTYTFFGGKYVGQDGSGSFDTMTFANGVWTWVDGSTGTKETYVEATAGSGVFRLERVTDVEGHSTRLTYVSGLIATVASWKSGDAAATSTVTLGYDASTKRLNQMSTVAAGATRTRVRYEYDALGRLSGVRTDLSPEDASMADGRVYTVNYGYDTAGRVNSIGQTDGTSLKVEYDASGRVSKYTDGLGRTTTISYDTTARTTTVLDAGGGSTVLSHDTAQRLVGVSGAALGGATFKQTLAWDGANGNLLSVKNGAGEATTFAYDTNGNRTRSTDAAGNVVEVAYDAANHEVTQTVYTVADPDGVAGPGVATGALKTQNLYDGTTTNRLRFTISPEGRVTQHQYNALGQRTTSTTYTGVLYTAKPSPLLNDLTTWAAALTSAELAAAEQKDYGYDPLGQLKSVKTYVSAGTTRTVSEQTYVYDAFGRLLQSTDATGNVTRYTYDGMDRVTLTHDGANRVTLYQYDDAGNRVVVQRPADNSTEVSVYDRAGQLVSKVLGATPQAIMSRTFAGAAAADWTGYDTLPSGVGFATATGATLSTGDTATTASRTIHGSRVHRFDSGTVFGAKVAVPALSPGQHFTIGAANVAGTRYHRALIRDGQLFAQFVEGGPKEVQLSSAGKPLVSGKVYRIEVETSDAGSTLFVYEEGSDRTSGFVHRTATADWGNARAQVAAQTSAGRSVQVLNIRALSEVRHGVAGSVLFDQRFGLQGGTAGLNGWPASNSLFTPGQSGLAVQTRLAGLTGAEQTVYGDAVHGGADVGGMQVRAEVTTSSAANGRNLRLGIASTATGADARALTARFINGDLFAEYRNTAGAWVQVKLSSATKLVKDGQAYVVEVSALAAGGAQLNVYERGTTAAAASAFSYTLSQAPWKDQRFMISAFGDAAAVSAVSTIGHVQEVQLASPAAALRTTYAYDSRGRLRQVIDGLGQCSHVLYDAAGRKVADIDAMGRYTEYLYDGAGRLVQTVVSDLPLSAAQLASLTDPSGNPAEVTLASVRPAVDADDRVSAQYYDKAGRLIGTQDAVGYLVERVYDGAGRLTSTVGRATAAAVTRIDTSGGTTVATVPTRPVATADATNDRTTRYFYSADGLLQSTLDADGFLVDVEYDAAGRKTAETRWSEAVVEPQRSGARSAMVPVARPDDRRTLWFYDTSGRVEGELDADGYLTTHGYDLAGRLTTTTRYLSTARLSVTAGANNTATHLARAGLTLAGVMPAVTTQVVTSRTYNAAGELVRESRPDGSVTRYVYDGNGRVVSTVVGLESAPRSTGTEYTGAGQVATEIDGLGNRVTHAYDSAGRRVSTTDARNNVTVFYYDASGLMRYSVLKAEKGGEVTAYSYNGMGQLVKQPVAYANRLGVAEAGALSGGAVTAALTTKFQALADASRDANIAYTYNKRGELTQEADVRGLRTFHDYTAFGQKKAEQVELEGRNPNRTEWRYDRRGNQLREEVDPLGLKLVTARQYDAFGRETARVDALNNRTSTDYRTNDGLADSGRQVVVTDALGKDSRIVYDALGRTVQVYDRLNLKTTYTYDTAARTMTVVTAEGVRTVTEYAATGEVVRLEDPNKSVTVFTYDKNGRLLTTKDALDNLVENTYDKNGNLTKVITGLKYAGGAAGTNEGSAITTEYTFDAANRVLTRLVDGTGARLSTSYEYDGRSREVKVTDANGTVTTKKFSTRGYLTEVVVDDVAGGLRLKTVYANDVTGRVVTVTEGADTPSARTTQYVYDDAGRREQEIVDPAGLKLTTTYTYDKVGQVVLKRDAMRHPTRYVYDGLGRLKLEIDPSGAVVQRSYDANGNLSATRAFVTRLPPSALVPASMSDAQVGAAVAALAAAGDQITQMAYDKDNRLRFTADAVGGLTETKYTKTGLVAEVVRYDTLFTGTLTADTKPVATPAKDQVTSTVYDAIGRARFVVDAENHVRELKYDRQGNVTTTIGYAKAITRPTVVDGAGVMTALQQVPDTANQRTTYQAYDAAGRMRFQQDAEGYVTEYVYDGLGQTVQTVRHDKPYAINTVPPTVAQLEQVTRTTAIFTSGLDGYTGTNGVVSSGQLKLTGGTASVREWPFMAGPRVMTPGGSIKLDFTPTTIQRKLHLSLESPESAYSRISVIWNDDGTIRAQEVLGAAEVAGENFGPYVVGKTYTVEITTHASGGAVFVYEKGTARESGFVYSTKADYRWTEFRPRFYTLMDPAAPIVTTALLDNVEERAASIMSSRYDAAGRMVASTDASGVVTKYVYDATGRTTDVTTAFGRPEASTLHRVFDAVGRMKEETAAFGTAAASTTLYGHDAQGRVTSKVSPRGFELAAKQPANRDALLARYTTYYERDVLGRVKVEKDAMGGPTAHDYDAFGNLIRTTDALGAVTSLYHDKLNRAVQVVNAEGFLTVSDFDAFGNVTKARTFASRVQRPLDGPVTLLAVGATVPASGAYLVEHPSLTKTTDYTYSRRNERKTTTDAERHVESTDYNAFGEVKWSTNRKNGTATFQYDRLGRMVLETLPEVSVNGTPTAVKNRYVYDAGGNRTTTIEAVGLLEERTTKYVYDATGRQVRRVGMAYEAHNVTDGTKTTVTPVEVTRYDAQGRVIESILAGGARTLSYYDAGGRKVIQIAADGAAIEYAYAADGMVLKEISYATAVSLPVQAGGQPPAMTRNAANDRVVSTEYDPLGRVMTVKLDAVNHWEHSGSGSLQLTLQGTFATVTMQALTYDAVGNLLKETDARGIDVFHYYDRLGRKVLTVDAELFVTAWDYDTDAKQANRQTSYSKRLTVAPAVQNDTAAAAERRDPVLLRAGLSSAKDRITTYALDRLERVVEQRTLNVESEHVNATGTVVRQITDAITKFAYDGLGNVTQQSVRVALLADGITSVWNVTDIGFDSLGRQISRLEPGYVDYLSNTVRPRSEIEYDALGNITREIQRGSNAAVESDDRITQYFYNVNGDRIRFVNANKNETVYDLDVARQVARNTVKAVEDANKNKRDLVKTHVYDLLGRIAVQNDVDTGEVRKFRYNAFGEISAKSLGDGWQEFIEYSVQGKVQKSNTGDGVVRIYLHDRNGNVTRQISSDTVNLRDMTVTVAAVDSRLLNSFSVYDKRNQLIRTVEPDIEVLKGDLQQAISQELADLYGSVTVGGANGQTYTPGQANPTAGGYTGVSPGGAQASVPGAGEPTIANPRTDGSAVGSSGPLTLTGLTLVSPPALQVTLGNRNSHPNRPPIGDVQFPVYGDLWQPGSYRVVATVGVVITNFTATRGVNSTVSAWRSPLHDEAMWYDAGFTIQRRSDGPAEQWVTVGVYGAPQPVYSDDGWPVAGAASTLTSSLNLLSVSKFAAAGTTELKAWVSEAVPQRVVPVWQQRDTAGGLVPDQYFLDISALPAGNHVVVLSGWDVQGRQVSAEQVNLSVAADRTPNFSKSAVPSDPIFQVATQAENFLGFHYGQASTTGTGTIYYRRQGDLGAWSTASLSQWRLQRGALTNALAGAYDMIVESGAQLSKGSFQITAANILVGGGALTLLSRQAETINFDLTASMVEVGAPSYFAVTTFNGTQVITRALSGRSLSFDASADFGVSPFENRDIRYEFKIFAGTPGDPQQIVGRGAGTVRVGSDPAVVSVDTQPQVRPQIAINLPSNVEIGGRLFIGSNLSDMVEIPAGHWRREHLGNQLVVDLSPPWYIPGSYARVHVKFESGNTTNFRLGDFWATGTYEIAGNGSLLSSSLQFSQRAPTVPIMIPGATSLTTLTMGPTRDRAKEQAVDMSRVSFTGNTFTWNAGNLARGVQHHFYYQTVDNTGGVNGQGYGSFILEADGSLRQLQLEEPEVKPPVFEFRPPAGAKWLDLVLRLDEPGAQAQPYRIEVVNGLALLKTGALLRAGVNSRYTVQSFRATTASNDLLSEGAGWLTVAANGTSAGELTPKTRDTNVILQGPQGKQVPKMYIEYRLRGSPTLLGTVTLDGVWKDGVSTFTWPLNALAQQGHDFDYVLHMRNANGTAFVNEVGDAIKVRGVLSVGDDVTNGAKMMQWVDALREQVQVSRSQTYNAFGEVAEEFDDRVLQRAQGMVAQYGGTVDAQALRTVSEYNTLGKLISKSDPQTHVTLENGFQSRARPITKFGYDLTGRVTTSTDANAVVTKLNYAGGGQQVSRQWSGIGAWKTNEYDILGNLAKRTDEMQAVTRQVFDLMGNLKETQRLGVQRVATAVGETQVSGTLTDSYAYDALGQRISHTNALGWVDKTFYDGLGRVVATSSTADRVTRYVYTALSTGIGGYELRTESVDGRNVVDRVDYFGKTLWHRDLGGRAFTYNFDLAGRLSSQTSVGDPLGLNQNIQYTYYRNGYIQEAKDLSTGMIANYAYDNAGNRVWESYAALDVTRQFRSETYQAVSITYDELNRMSKVSDPSVDVRYEYDAVGNRRAVHAVYWDPTTLGVRREDHFWYKYDANNRFEITKGSLNGARAASAADTTTKVVRGAYGTQLTYDAIDQRRSAISADGKLEEYSYTVDGYLEDTKLDGTLIARRVVDALGRTLEYKNLVDKTTRTTKYDKENRTLEDSIGGTVTKYNYYEAGSGDTLSSSTGTGSLATTVQTAPGSSVSTTTYKYEYWDDAKQSQISLKVDAGASSPAPGFSQLTYNANGHLVKAWDEGSKIRTTYSTSAQGLVLKRESVQFPDTNNRKEVGKQFYFYADGRRIGEVADNNLDQKRVSYAESLAIKDRTVDRNTLYKNFRPVTSADFDQNYEPINEAYPSAVGGTYTVRGGDTLSSIARAVWGDSAMWYLLADANGLTGTESLAAGRVLQIPNKVTNVHNNANTFRPYNAGEAIGRIDPTLPAPPSPGKGCGAIGTIIMVVIAVIVTIYTAGAAAPLLGAATGGAATTMGAGLAVLSGTAAVGASGAVMAATVAAAAIGGAVGSIAGQVAGMAMGMQDKFSWKQVGLSALGSAVTSGVGVALGSAGVTAQSVGSKGLFAGIQGATGTAASQAIQGKWNWRGIAASGLGAAIGAKAGRAFGESAAGAAVADATNFANRMVTGVSGSMASQLIASGKADPRSAFGNTLGNALGDSLAGQMSSAGETPLPATAENTPTGQSSGSGWYGLGGMLGSAELPQYDWGVGSFLVGGDGAAPDSATAAGEQYLDSDDDSLMGGQRRVGVAGKDAADGAWGIARGKLGPNASDGALNRYKNQLLRLNPELADVVQVGQQYYLPDASTPENIALARAADRRYQPVVAAQPSSAVEAVSARSVFAGDGPSFSDGMTADLELNRFTPTNEVVPTTRSALSSFEPRLLQPGETIRGNLFFGGAGMDGGYIKDMVRAFGEKGIALTPVDREKWSGGTLLDASLGVDVYRSGKFPSQVLLDNFNQAGPQFNLVGYSYGSLAAAQVAANYAGAGTQVDNLVLIGSPIGEKFLNQLQSTPNIKNVVVINLNEQGDPIRAGMTRNDLLLSAPTLAKQMVESSGHFYYAPSTPEGQGRRDALAGYLYSNGVR